MSIFITASQLAIFTAARKPQWIEQEEANSTVPTSISVGISMEDAVFAAMTIEVREDVSRRTARVKNTIFDASATWTVTIGGFAVVYVAGALDTFADVLDGLVAQLLLVAGALALVSFTAADEDGDGTNETLLIKGKALADYAIAITVTGGTADFNCDADAVTASLEVWRLPKMSNPKSAGGVVPRTWSRDRIIGVIAREVSPVALTTVNFSDFLQVNGYAKVYAQLATVGGVGGDAAVNGAFNNLVRVLFGPALQE